MLNESYKFVARCGPDRPIRIACPLKLANLLVQVPIEAIFIWVDIFNTSQLPDHDPAQGVYFPLSPLAT